MNEAEQTKTASDALARNPLCPTIRAAITINEYSTTDGNLDLTRLAEALANQVKTAKAGDRTHAEAMLIAQAHTLDAIFNNLATSADDTGYLKKLDLYLKLALRAQSQCRATWEALAAIKHPPMVGYVKQANIAHGPQQVNNAAVPAHAPSPAPNNENSKNEVLEANDGERLDVGATSTTSGAHPAMATLGALHRP